MTYFFNTPEDQRVMLSAIGVNSVDDLFRGIPESMRLARPLNLPAAMSELELAQHMSRLAGRNVGLGNKVCFLGGGSYDHFVPNRKSTRLNSSH